MDIKKGESWDSFLSRLLDMVKQGDNAEIEAHIAVHPFFKESEEVFIKSASQEHLVHYLVKWTLDAQNRPVLKARSDYSEIMEQVRAKQAKK